MKTDRVFFIVFAAAASLIAFMLVKDRFKKKKLAKLLRRRPQLNDSDFGRRFFPTDPARAELAIRARKVLAKNLQLSLDGLQPEDKLNADLDAQLERNWPLFWDLGTEFGFQDPLEDLEAHEKSLARLVTFADLVDYVENKVREKTAASSAASSPPPAQEASSSIYDSAIRSIPILCVTGFVTALVGGFMKKPLVLKLGIGLFLSGFAVWGLANGGGFVSEMVRTMRLRPLKEITAHPWWLAIYIILTLFFLWFGASFLWMAARTFFTK